MMNTDVDSMSELEKELAHHKVRADIFESTNDRLRKDLQTKTDLLKSCAEDRDSAQALADKWKEELSRKTTELDEVRTLQKKTRQRLGSVSESEQILKGKYAAEFDLREATFAELKKEQANCGEMEAKIGTLDARVGTLEASINSRDDEIKSRDDEIKSRDDEIKSRDDEIKSRDDEVKTLKSSNRSKDEEIVLKNEEIRGLRESARAKQDELADLTRQIAEKEQQLEGKRADLEKTGMDKADVERDLGLVLSLSIHASDVRVQDWVPLLRSLRESAPVGSSPGENLLAPVWAILPSWVDPSPEEETVPGSFERPAVPTSPDGLLFELFGHAMADGDIRSGECLRALASLSAHVGRHGLTKVSSFIIVLEELVTRAQKLEAISGYHCMLLLGLKYLASLTRSRVLLADAPSLSVIEDSLDALMDKAGKSLGVIRDVTDALCVSGDFETCEPTCFLRMNSVQGRNILIFAQPRHPDELFLLADPEKRTVWAVSLNRYEFKITVDEDGKLVKGAIIRAPAGQPDIKLALTDEEYNWILKCL